MHPSQERHALERRIHELLRGDVPPDPEVLTECINRVHVLTVEIEEDLEFQANRRDTRHRDGRGNRHYRPGDRPHWNDRRGGRYRW